MVKKYWAGFCDDRLFITSEFDFCDEGENITIPAVYLRKKDANKRFQDVRPVEIREIKKK